LSYGSVLGAQGLDGLLGLMLFVGWRAVGLSVVGAEVVGAEVVGAEVVGAEGFWAEVAGPGGCGNGVGVGLHVF
jgi:hypothetical protein